MSAATVPPVTMSDIYCTHETLKATVDKYGVAAIRNVITPAQCAEMLIGMDQAMEKLLSKMPVPFKADDPSTWKTLGDAAPLHTMIFQHSSVGCAKYSVDIRQNPDVAANFAELYECSVDDLWVSSDGVAAYYPCARKTNPRTKTMPDGSKAEIPKPLHVDNNPRKKTADSVQSWVTALDVLPGDATLTVLARGNTHWAEFSDRFATTVKKGPAENQDKWEVADSNDWHVLSEEQYAFFTDRGCNLLKIECEAGTQVFWNSCTPHKGTPAEQPFESRSKRCVVYVCMAPASFAERRYCNGKFSLSKTHAKAIEKKRASVFRTGRNTSHSPTNFRTFPLVPHMPGGAPPPDLVRIASEADAEERLAWLTPLGRKLFSVDEDKYGH